MKVVTLGRVNRLSLIRRKCFGTVTALQKEFEYLQCGASWPPYIQILSHARGHFES